MQYILLFLILTSFKVRAQCDSTVVIYQTNHDQFEPVTFVGLQIDSFVDGKLDTRHFSFMPSIKYDYDSLGRLTSITSSDSIAYFYDSLSRLLTVDYFNWNGFSWDYKTDTSSIHYFYSANRLDSVIKYVWNGNNLIPFYRLIHFYNPADTLFRINLEKYDSANSWYIDTLTIVSYAPFRIDSSYASGAITTYQDEIRTYDSLERILSIINYYSGNADQYEFFTYKCNQLETYIRSHFGSHNSFNVWVTFDSLCRINKIVSGYYQMTGGNSINEYEYFYTNCNTMIVRADEDQHICQGDTAELSVMHFGGTPPYRLTWTPNSVFPDDTSYTVYTAPDSSTSYLVTVVDSNGLTVTDTLLINVANRPEADIYISSIDTFSVCQSATLAIDSINGVYYNWSILPSPATISNQSEIDIIYNGTYMLVAQENNSHWLVSCPIAVDTFEFNYFSNPAPIVTMTLECDHIVAHSTEDLQFQWYKNNVLLADSMRDSLYVNQFATYFVVGIDSSGCSSAIPNNFILYQVPSGPLSLSVNITHPTCDTCSDGLISFMGSGGAQNYTYYINGIRVNAHWADSMSSGIYEFCVTDRNNCEYCLSGVYIPVNEITNEQINYFPNPFHDKIHFIYPDFRLDLDLKFLLYDASGRMIKDFKITSGEFTLSKETMKPGMYFFSIVKNGIIQSRGKVILY